MIMNKIIIICCFALSCTNLNKTVKEEKTFTNIHEGYVFKSFYNAGTTASLRKFYIDEKKDFSNKEKISENQLSKLKGLLENLKWNNHKQKKITGIQLAVELFDYDDSYCLLFTKNVVFDISRNLECKISLEQSSAIIEFLYE